MSTSHTNTQIIKFRYQVFNQQNTILFNDDNAKRLCVVEPIYYIYGVSNFLFQILLNPSHRMLLHFSMNQIAPFFFIKQ